MIGCDIVTGEASGLQGGLAWGARVLPFQSNDLLRSHVALMVYARVILYAIVAANHTHNWVAQYTPLHQSLVLHPRYTKLQIFCEEVIMGTPRAAKPFLGRAL